MQINCIIIFDLRMAKRAAVAREVSLVASVPQLATQRPMIRTACVKSQDNHIRFTSMIIKLFIINIGSAIRIKTSGGKECVIKI